MKIDIHKELSWGVKYRIVIDGQEKYFATQKRWSLSYYPNIKLFENQTNKEIYTIKKDGWAGKSCDLIKHDGSTFQFRTKNFWKVYYYCKVGQDLYEIYPHKGRKYSVYKNEIQIAWWDKNVVTWSEEDHYMITANNDCDVELVVCFCFIINFPNRDDGGSTVKFDFGNIGPQVKTFDDNWQPKA